MKKFNRIAAFLLVLAISLSLCSCGKTEETSKKPSKPYSKLNLASIESGRVAENNSFALDWDAERACVILTDKASGNVWSSIPDEYYKTGETSGRAGIMMGSPILVEYVSSKNKSAVKSVNGYTGIIKNGKIGSVATENGVKVYYCFDKLEVIVPVSYTLTENGLKVSVAPGELIEYDNLVYKVSIAPFMCSAKNTDNKDEQYLFVPSGSGALMYTDYRSNPKAREYCETVFGSDLARFESQKFINTESVRIPAFGAKDGDKAMLGIITEGAAAAEIEALVADEKIGWSGVYPTFSIRGSNISAVAFNGGNVSEVENITEEKTGYKALSVEYRPLMGADADYSGMAEAYRKYIKSGSEKTDAESSMLTVKFLGGLQLKSLMLGIPYNKTVSATTFEEALEIVKDIEKTSGVSPDVILSGFGKEGLDVGKIAGGYDFGSVMGSKKDVKALAEYCKKQGIELYADYDIIRFKKSSSGFSSTFDAAKSANSFTSYQYRYNVALRDQDDEAGRYVLLSRAKLFEASEKLVKKVKKYGITGIGLSSLGSLCYSDYDSIESSVRAGSESDARKIIENARKNGYKIMVGNANSYAASIADKITDAPVNSSMYDYLDADVPFYQMAFKGVTDISASAVNTASNTRASFLKAIEGGSGLEFVLSARYEADFATTAHSAFAVALYSDNSELISSLVKESREFYDAISGAEISEHRIISDTLRLTEFDNGVKLLVNYGDTAASADGMTAEPLSFVFRGDEQ